MNKYKYIIVGGGLSADAAVRGIRSTDTKGSIAMFCEESVPPYSRPPLSKALWKGAPLDEIWCHPDKTNLEIKVDNAITEIDVRNKIVTDSLGIQYSYEKLLLATGVSPRELPYGSQKINYYRTIKDYQNLKSKTETGDHFLVIGGGFIGSEIAAALAMNDKKVTIIFPEEGISARIFTRDTAQHINDYYREKGVNVQNGMKITAIEEHDARQIITAQDDKSTLYKFEGDAIIAGIGTLPNSSLAADAGLTTSNGIEVNEFLQTSVEEIYAAGDVADFFDPAVNTRRRVEHEDNANQMGFFAGRNMAGARSRYNHLPFFYSDLFKIGYEAVGELDSRYEIVEDWVDRYNKGVLYYLKESIVKGVLLWNTWGKLDEARALIRSQTVMSREDLKNRIHD